MYTNELVSNALNGKTDYQSVKGVDISIYVDAIFTVMYQDEGTFV